MWARHLEQEMFYLILLAWVDWNTSLPSSNLCCFLSSILCFARLRSATSYSRNQSIIHEGRFTWLVSTFLSASDSIGIDPVCFPKRSQWCFCVCESDAAEVKRYAHLTRLEENWQQWFGPTHRTFDEMCKMWFSTPGPNLPETHGTICAVMHSTLCLHRNTLLPCFR